MTRRFDGLRQVLGELMYGRSDHASLLDFGDNEMISTKKDSESSSHNLYSHKNMAVYVYAEAYLLRGEQAIVPVPCLIMDDPTFRELAYYFSRIPKEMQVMGFIEKNNRNCFLVTELVIPFHASSFSDADLDQDKFTSWLNLLEAQGKDITKLRFQAHSHGFHPAYFSNTDINTIRDAYSCDWMVSLVGDRSCTFLARLDIFKPVSISIALPLIVRAPLFPSSQEEQAKWDANLEAIG